jgi:signal transduction histidine kinase
MPTPLNVLIVEDCDDDAVLIVDCLAQSGYHLYWERAQSAEQLAAALALPHEWDLILSDYAMPGFGGVAALEICKGTGRDIPFILISGSIGEEKAVEAMRSGAHDYIMKDRMQRLGPAVDRELREAALRKERSTAVHENVRLGSELVAANAALKEKLDQLSRSRADLEQVAWAAGHDLKEPLRAITMYTQLLLRRRPAVNPEEVEFAGYINDGVARTRALIDGLLAYSRNLRAPADPLAIADPEDAVQTAIENLAPRIEEAGGIITVDPLPMARIEQTALTNIFGHLLINALEYAREGVAPEIHISASRKESEIRFAVADNGIGIKPEHQARVFELFRRLHGSEHPGIGVGLPLCKCLIENYGGRLWVESEPGVGSTFYFTLSAVERAAVN